MIKKIRSKFSFKKGFTLVETLVAIAILSAAMAGPMTLAIKSIGTASISQDQLTAFYLGEEAIEYVKNVRDSNSNGSDPNDPTTYWLNNLNPCIGLNLSGLKKTCQIEAIGGSVVSYDPNQFLSFDQTTKQYNYAITKGFTRTVHIDNPPVSGNGDEAIVTVIVSWQSKIGPRSLTLYDNLYNYK